MIVQVIIKKDKPTFKIFRSLKYIKIHCRDNIDHRKDLKDKKSDNKGIRLIKKYVFKLYKLMKETSSKDEQDVNNFILILILNMSPRGGL